MNRFIIALASVVALTLLAGCGKTCLTCAGDGEALCDGTQVDCDGTCIDAIPATLEGVATRVFEKSCAYSTCHDADSPAAGLAIHDLESIIAAIDSPSGQEPSVMQFAPGDSANSYIYRKMVGENMAATDVNGNAGTIMPPGSKLCEPKVEAVRAWIDGGALAD